MNKTVINIQLARHIIKDYGEPHQYFVVEKLRGLTYYHDSHPDERNAQKVICNMAKDYTLDTANIIVADKYNDLVGSIKERLKDQEIDYRSMY